MVLTTQSQKLRMAHVLARQQKYSSSLRCYELWNRSRTCMGTMTTTNHYFSSTLPSATTRSSNQDMPLVSFSNRRTQWNPSTWMGATAPFSSSTGDGEEETKSQKESREFQAETRQLLDIVTNSLYTDREVFLRELISNASDALEKLRHLQVAGGDRIAASEEELEIHVTTDDTQGTLTITDTGIGMTKEEMISNLGTIARSGSKAFVTEMSSGGGDALSDVTKGIIGKFGVGFYSAFMVSDKVEVRSRSARSSESEKTPLVWSSEGIGSYDIYEFEEGEQKRGASIVMHLKNADIQYSDEKTVEKILKKYSNFVNFPIYLNGNRLNTIKAVWAEEPSSVTDETYTDFYKYVANAFDEPLDKIHYRADAPLEIKALFYIPSFHSEKYGMGRMEPGVSLYSRKVLIEAKSADILPEWLRFIKGVVDSEDLPLAISREKSQDTALIAKLRKALTRRIIAHLTKMAKKDTEKYKDEFYKEYAFFLKEGVCQDFEFQDQLSKLLYFESSKTMNGEISSLDEYVSRCKPEQKEIYYLCAPSRELAIQSPYLEAFEKSGREVIFVYTAIDDFVMANLQKYQDRAIVNVEKGDIDLGDDNDDSKEDDKDDESQSSRLSSKDASEFCAWFQLTLNDKVSSCKVTNRLSSSPAVVTNNESGAMRRMMRMVDNQDSGSLENMPLTKQQVEINANHPIIAGLNSIREKEPELAKVCAEQIFDNCLVAAGLLDDGRSMLGRLNDLLLCVVKGADSTNGVTSETTKPTANSTSTDDETKK